LRYNVVTALSVMSVFIDHEEQSHPVASWLSCMELSGNTSSNKYLGMGEICILIV